MANGDFSNLGGYAAVPFIWRDQDRKRIRKTIQQALVDDPEIADATNISVVFSGEDRKELEIVGSVEDERSAKRAREIAERHTAEDVSVVNKLTVD